MNNESKLSEADNPKTSGRTLAKLATSKVETIRCAVAQHPNTPKININRLARDQAWSVRASAARNVKISIDVLTKLSFDEEQAVRFYVANNPRTPGETLVRMAKVEHRDGVRLEISRNISTPVKALIKLLEDPYIEVRISASNNPRIAAAIQLFDSGDGFADLSLAEFVEKVGT